MMKPWRAFYRIGYGHNQWLADIQAASGEEAFDIVARKHMDILSDARLTCFYVACVERIPYTTVGFGVEGERWPAGHTDRRPEDVT